MSYGTAPYGTAAFGTAGASTTYRETLAEAVAAADAFSPLGREALLEALAAADATTSRHLVALLEALAAADATTSRHLVALIDAAAAHAQAASTGAFRVAAVDGPLVDAVAQIVLRLTGAEVLVPGDVALETQRRILAAVEAVCASGIAASWLSAQELVVTALVLEDLAQRGGLEALTDAVQVADLASARARHYAALVEAAVAADLAESRMRFTLFVEDAAVAADVATSQARFLEALRDGALATATLRVGGESYVAWVVNGDTQAASRYDNFAFNSFAAFEIGGVRRYFGARDDGLYELAGADDAGAAIAAMVRGGLSNFGNAWMKSMPAAYLAYTTDGALVLKLLITSPEGRKEAHWYRLEGRTAQAVREDRVKPDGGLQSVYWQWELVNLAGADFDIDSMAFVPLNLSRRV